MTAFPDYRSRDRRCLLCRGHVTVQEGVDVGLSILLWRPLHPDCKTKWEAMDATTRAKVQKETEEILADERRTRNAEIAIKSIEYDRWRETHPDPTRQSIFPAWKGFIP